jgi:predicted Zn finger-like uncharacterized protein
MIIECINCRAKYDVPDSKIRNGLKLKCSRCNKIFSTDDLIDNSSGDEKDTAKMTKDNINDSLWSNENLKLPLERKFSIAVIKGARAGYIYHIEKPYILVGRGKVDLIIPDKEVSRKHIAIEFRNKRITLRDLGSTNGTFIDNEKISITELSEQIEFRIGKTTLMLISTPRDIDQFEE